MKVVSNLLVGVEVGGVERVDVVGRIVEMFIIFGTVRQTCMIVP